MTRDELHAALDSVTVVDAQPPARYGQRHLPRALNLVAEDSDEHVMGALPDAAGTRSSCTRPTPGAAARPSSPRGCRRSGTPTCGSTARASRTGSARGCRSSARAAVTLELSDLALGPTAFLFEGFPRAGVDISIFVTRTPPGRAVELHVHPYAETFLLLAGRGRWTRGEETVELEPEGMLVVPPDTPHGFRNVGDVPLLVVSVHERGTLRQTWLGEDPA